jgi:poly(3-hydroxybutyrate) depolymerase
LFVDLLSKERVGVAPTTGMSNMANMAQAAQQAQPQVFAAGAA